MRRNRLNGYSGEVQALTRIAAHEILGGNALFVTTFGEFLQHLAVERRDVGGFAAGDQSFIDMDLFVYPIASGILNIGFQRRPRGHRTAVKDVSFD